IGSDGSRGSPQSWREMQPQSVESSSMRSLDGRSKSVHMSRDARFARLGTCLVVALAVATSLLLIAVSAGVESKISGLVADPRLTDRSLLNVDLVRSILHQLTAVVVMVELLSLALTCWVLGEITMRSRRTDIGIDRL